MNRSNCNAAYDSLSEVVRCRSVQYTLDHAQCGCSKKFGQ